MSHVYQACLKRVHEATTRYRACPQYKGLIGSAATVFILRSPIAIDCFQQHWANVAGQATVSSIGSLQLGTTPAYPAISIMLKFAQIPYS